jgi:DNA invertase Pin-like site-specific DNA recombinase
MARKLKQKYRKKVHDPNEKFVFGVYIRVSTEKQADTGDSIEMQLNLAKQYVEKNNGILPEENIFIEPAVSASKTELKDRIVLLQCINKGEKGGFDKLLVYRRDRLARNTEDSSIIRGKLQRAGIDLVFTASGDQGELDLSNPTNILIESVRASMDEIESIQTSIRVSDTMEDKAKRGEWTGGNLPYGWTSKGDGKVEFIESERGVIEEIEDMYLAGFGMKTIAKWLNGEKINNLGVRPNGKANRLKQFKTSSELWTRDSIAGILFNPFYAGYIWYSPDGQRSTNKDKDSIIIEKGKHKAIRSEEKHKLIQMKREEKAKKTKAPRFYNTSFLLSGLLFCQECGQKFITRNSTRSNGNRYSYYVCNSRYTHVGQGNCSSPSFKQEIIEEFVMNAIKQYISKLDITHLKDSIEKQLMNSNSDDEEKLNAINKKISRLEKDYKAMTRLLLDLDDEDEMYEELKTIYQSDQKEILKNSKKLKVEKEYIIEKLDSGKIQKVQTEQLVERLKNFTDIIDSQPFHYQKALLDELIDKIEIDKEGNLEFGFNIQLDVDEKEEDSNISFMSLGGVGDTTTHKNITLMIPFDKHLSENLTNTILHTIYNARKYFPVWLKTISNKQDLSSYVLHQTTGISYTTCRTFLNDKNCLPTKKTFSKIEKAYNITLADFIKFAKIKVSSKIFFDVIDSAEPMSKELKQAQGDY